MNLISENVSITLIRRDKKCHYILVKGTRDNAINTYAPNAGAFIFILLYKNGQISTNTGIVGDLDALLLQMCWSIKQKIISNYQNLTSLLTTDLIVFKRAITWQPFFTLEVWNVSQKPK